MRESKLEVKSADGTVVDCLAYRPDGPGPYPAVIFYFDAGGVRDAMKQMASRLASYGYFVLLPNLYQRSGPFAPFNTATVFTDPRERERLMKLVESTPPPVIMADTRAFLAALAAQPDVQRGQVGAVGYCLGGRLAFVAAATFPDRIGAAAAIHAGGLVSDQPDSPHRLASQIKAQLYLGVADDDRSCTPEHQATLKAALDAREVPYQMELYAGAHHGFAVPDMPVFDKDAAERHWTAVSAFFAASLPHVA